MELGTTLIGIICVAICAMPFVLTNRSKKAIVKRQLIVLKDLASQHNNTITQNEINSFYAIGIDESKKSVSFILKEETEVEQQFVDLSTIKSCEIVNITKSKHIDRLYLKLIPHDKTKKEVNLEFFNADVSYQLGEELQSIEKWNKIINNLLETKQ
ncbi:hypothetical protein [Algibacter lectus]|uniref:Uncharacterized protein n=2 Tax=Algibacter lectus TaxID=221126 RepID=A0A090WP99_9FLAO|nr:hypothetical protein [Algibacter lectus]GAL77993.1 hypothetical protein JCM19274_4492 [Algibacter lectus]SFD06533.1 hypothetical protein SAMN04489722_10535 [Algibacter lectus]